MKQLIVNNVEVCVRGRVARTARLRNEWYDFVADSAGFVEALKKSPTRANLFTFLPEIHASATRCPYYSEPEAISVLPIRNYEEWWKKQISDKTRNMARKAAKKGVEIRVSELTDDFVRGIMEIHNESPVRQGKKFWHYGKDFETTKRDNGTYSERSRYIGAYLGSEMIGFIKLVYGNETANLMQILSKIVHRDKAPTNALLAKAIELCAERRIPRLHYGMWSTRGLGEFKKSHGFQRVEIPRYYVPLNLFGRVMLALRFHRQPSQYVPEQWRDQFAQFRGKWYEYKYRSQTA